MGNLEATKAEEEVIRMVRKKKPLTFGQKLQRSVDRHNRRQQESMARFRAEQARQGLRPDQPISLMDMMKGIEKRKKKK